MESMTEVTSEDLAGVYKDLAETVGVENAYKIYSHFKGLQLMFPLKFYSKTYIMQQICSEYNGKNVHAQRLPLPGCAHFVIDLKKLLLLAAAEARYFQRIYLYTLFPGIPLKSALSIP